MTIRHQILSSECKEFKICCRIVIQKYPGVQNTNVLRGLRALRNPKYERVKGCPGAWESKIRTCYERLAPQGLPIHDRLAYLWRHSLQIHVLKIYL